jgi:hypothetical protein
MIKLAPFMSTAAAEEDSSGVIRVIQMELIGVFAGACGRGLETGIARVPICFVPAIGRRTMHEVEASSLIESCVIHRK